MLYFKFLNDYFGYNFDISLHPYPHPYQEDETNSNKAKFIHTYEAIMDTFVCIKNVFKYYIFLVLHMVGLYHEKRVTDKKYEFPIISKFDKVKRYSNSIYIFDIDDTIFYYEDLRREWWEKTIKYNYEHGMNELNADYMALRKWERLIYYQKPTEIDRQGLNYLIDFINQSDSVFYFITSRGSNHSFLTYRHLQSCIDDNIDGKITFADGRNKGHVLRKLYLSNKIENIKYNKIVFIDDVKKNLIHVKNEFPEADCYEFALFE